MAALQAVMGSKGVQPDIASVWTEKNLKLNLTRNIEFIHYLIAQPALVPRQTFQPSWVS